nr:MAG: nsp1a [Astroviridae sp.]
MEAFHSLSKKHMRVVQTQGASKLTSGPGTMALFCRMKDKYGLSQAWKDLMDSDAVMLIDITLAYGYKDGTVSKFTAVRTPDGLGHVLNYSVTSLPEQDEALLKAQASNQARLRLVAQQSSSRLEENMRLREKILGLQKQIDEERLLIKHRDNEIKHLRETYREHKEKVEAAVARTSLSWTAALVLILMLLFGILTGEARADDCSRPIKGCYVNLKDQREHAGYTFGQLQHLCYGETTTVLPSFAVNDTKLREGCVQDLMKSMKVQDDNATRSLCNHLISTMIKTTVCDTTTYYQRVSFLLRDFFATFQWPSPSIFLPFVSYLVVLVTVISGTNWYKTAPIMTLGVFLNIPTLYTSILVNFFPLETAVFAYIAQITPAEITPWIFVAHWIVIVLKASLLERTLPGISRALLLSMLLPLWNYSMILVRELNLNLPTQVLLFVVGVTLSIGTRYANSTVVITQPDGSSEKVKRMELFQNGLKEKFLKLQSAIRGVIPEIPDKTRCVCRVETNQAEGVAFRFMNELVTIGHVVGNEDTVTFRWNGLTSTQVVKRRIPLFESCDDLVFFKLPNEFQAMKPLRLSKIETSDYMQLLSYRDGEVATYTGWVIRDGNWLSNVFQTKPGDSGAPYVDRNGRLVGIHLGTQGVVAQGYDLTTVLKPSVLPPLAPVNEPPPVFELTEEQIQKMTAALAQAQCQPSYADLADEITQRVITGTKVSHSALTGEMERMGELLANLCDMVQCQQKMIQAQDEKISVLEKLVLDQVMVPEKKKGKNKQGMKNRFMKMRVLTEEQYRQMLEEGWTKDEIMDAVRQLREQAWLNYELEQEEDYEPEEILDAYMLIHEKTKPTAGKRTLTAVDEVVMVLDEARKSYRCPKCQRTFKRGQRHNPKTCGMMEQSIKKEEVIAEVGAVDLTKNLKTGGKGTSR